jgi:hypothetical protein
METLYPSYMPRRAHAVGSSSYLLCTLPPAQVLRERERVKREAEAEAERAAKLKEVCGWLCSLAILSCCYNYSACHAYIHANMSMYA